MTRSLFRVALALSISILGGCGSDDSAGGSGGTGAGGTSTGGTSTGGTGTGGTPSGGGSGGTAGSGGAGGTAGGGPTCGSDAWVTYGHDGQRTSTSDGCISGTLTTLWGYEPVPPTGKDVSKLWSPVATPDAVYLHWAATIPPYVGTTAADRIDTTGKRVWTFDSGSDANFGDWPSLWKDRVVLNADGIYMLDATTGKKAAGTGVDWWGQSIPTDAALLLSNTSKADGPGLFVAALDDKAAVLWKQNEQGTQCGQALADQTGGIALDGTTLFYAPRYATGSATQPTFASGVYAFDTSANGAQVWKVATTPRSAISAAGGMVFLVEQSSTGTSALVARKQTDGSVAWSKDLASSAGVQAPAVAAGTVIVGTQGGLQAFGASDGAPRWNTPTPSGYTAPASLTITNGCGGKQPIGNLPDSAIAVAGGSATVVVTQGKEVFVLSLSDGQVGSPVTPEGVTGTLVDPIIVGKRVYVVERATPSRVVALEAP